MNFFKETVHFLSIYYQFFEMYTNEKGEEVYFMKFFYYFLDSRYYMFKTESDVEEGEVTINKTSLKK
jgi:hypothetical protein